jgi:hypothetical protein
LTLALSTTRCHLLFQSGAGVNAAGSAASLGRQIVQSPKVLQEESAAGTVPLRWRRRKSPQYIFAVFVSRSESEIVVDPRRLRKFQAHDLGDQCHTQVKPAA